jgi:maltose/moltooligosaccharide transporter
MAAGLLWILDASVNVSMEPFRAFVGDMLPEEQRKVGFSMQSLLIGLGAVLSMSLPWVLSNVFGVAAGNEDGGNAVPRTVHLAFYIGAVVFLVAVIYTVVTTREYPPADLAKFEEEKRRTAGFAAALREIVGGLFSMPLLMRRLAVVQFFTWLGLFCMWIYFTPAITARFFDSDPTSSAYQAGVEWGGVCMSIYNGVAFFFAFGLIALVRRLPARSVHAVCLVCGGLGLLSVGLLPTEKSLIFSMVGVGVAWASILALPYAMLSNVLPPDRMGFYMGVFNYCIVLPQILAAVLLGPVVKTYFNGAAMPIVMGGGLSMLLAAGLLLLLVPTDEAETAEAK